MPEPPHPTDRAVLGLLSLYDRATRRLELVVQDGLRRGLEPGIGSQGYRERQLAQARAILAELDRTGPAGGALIVRQAHAAGGLAVARTLGDGAAVAGGFGRVNVPAVEALASNMATNLSAAIRLTGQNVETVFERADRIDGALRHGRSPGPIPFIGRRINDVYRSSALEEVAQGVIAGESRREVSRALADRLVRQGTTDALTGFIDRGGNRWDLNHYTAMVARTTTREAMTRGTVDRMTAGGSELVTVSSHADPAPYCVQFDGETFSLSGATPGYDVLDELAPFHPNCRHVIGPADANLDDFERELERAMAEVGGGGAPAQGLPATKPTPPAYTAATPPKKGEAVRFTEGLDPLKPAKPVPAGQAKVVEVKGNAVMLNAGTPSKPRWVQTTLDKLEVPAKAPAKAAASGPVELPIPAPFSTDPLKGAAARAHLAQHKGILDADAKKAVKRYSGDDFFQLNIDLRHRKTPALARDLDRAFEQVAPTTEPVTLFRGSYLDRVKGLKVEPGRVLTDKAFASTSARRSVAEDFADGEFGDVLEIECPPGMRLLDVNRVAGSQNAGESEILLPRGARMVITEVRARKPKRGKTGRLIRCRVVLDDE